MRFLYLTRLILLVFVFSISAFGQEKIESAANKQVLLNVTVINIDDEPIKDLKGEHFRLYEDKKLLKISYFSNENSPISVGFLLDVSPSMGTAVDLCREGILAFLEKSNSKNEYFVAAFSKTVDVLSEFADSKKTIEVVRASPYFSKSHGRQMVLYDAIVLGIENLSKAKNQKKVLFVFGDGEDSKSSKTYKDVEKIVKEKNIVIYFVGLARLDDLERYTSQLPFQKITEVSGGKAFYLYDYGQNNIVFYRSKLYSRREFFILKFSKFADQLQNQYTIGFKSNLDSKENKWQNLEIKLEIPKEIRKKTGQTFVRYRRGYYPLSEVVIGN